MPAPQTIQHDDSRFMAAAIRFARCHIGLTGENPSVGALIVRDDGQGPYIAGRGVTKAGGRPHAETEALDEAGPLARGATVYVTLEPCSHYGRTPPCADALVNAGVRRVVIAADDPDPRVNGGGITRLRQAGVEVVRHVLTDMAAAGLGAYLCSKTLRRPEVTLKLAVSRDGCIGREGEGNVPVSGAVSRAQAHILRAESDAILAGIGTALADDPLLDCRLPGLEARSPVRIILDRRLRLSPHSRLVESARQHALWIVCDDASAAEGGKTLLSAGCRIVHHRMPEGPAGLHGLLAWLWRQEIHSLLVEGGAQIAALFWNNGLVDRLVLFQSPLVIGAGGYKAPDFSRKMQEYRQTGFWRFGEDCCTEWKRIR